MIYNLKSIYRHIRDNIANVFLWYCNRDQRCHSTRKPKSTTFQAVGLLGSLWKHQQSRDLNFLHRNCTQLFFSTPKKKLFFEIEKKSEIFFGDFSKSGENQHFHRKNLCFFIEKTMIFSMKKLIFSGFWKILKKKSQIFFRSHFFFGVEKKSWIQLRCKKLRSLDCWCFQSDPSNPTARKIDL